MAHSKPPGIGDRGNAWRITTVAGCFVTELCTDRRVNELLYAQWRAWREKENRAVHAAIEAGQLDDAAMSVVVERFNNEQRDTIERFVRDVLNLPERLPRSEQFAQRRTAWVAWSLLNAFLIRVRNEQHPDHQETFSIEVLMPTLAPKGRRPRDHGRDLERAVRWYYRALIKQPPDSIHEMAREYATSAGRDNDCRSVIQNAIDQVQVLLDLVTERYIVRK